MKSRDTSPRSGSRTASILSINFHRALARLLIKKPSERACGQVLRHALLCLPPCSPQCQWFPRTSTGFLWPLSRARDRKFSRPRAHRPRPLSHLHPAHRTRKARIKTRHGSREQVEPPKVGDVPLQTHLSTLGLARPRRMARRSINSVPMALAGGTRANSNGGTKPPRSLGASQ